MNPVVNDLAVVFPPDNYHVVLDGRVVGFVEEAIVDDLVASLKYLKVKQVPDKLVPYQLEIGYIPKTYLEKNPNVPGLYLFTNEARFLRPVKHLRLNEIEWISPFEQSNHPRRAHAHTHDN